MDSNHRIRATSARSRMPNNGNPSSERRSPLLRCGTREAVSSPFLVPGLGVEPSPRSSALPSGRQPCRTPAFGTSCALEVPGCLSPASQSHFTCSPGVSSQRQRPPLTPSTRPPRARDQIPSALTRMGCPARICGTGWTRTVPFRLRSASRAWSERPAPACSASHGLRGTDPWNRCLLHAVP